MSTLGVIIVTYNASDVICDCLETLLASRYPMQILVVDNASTDGTVQTLSRWCEGTDGYQAPCNLPFHANSVPKPVTQVNVVASTVNDGFAAGVNIGIRHLLTDKNIDRVWILNPDTLVPPETPENLANAPSGFALMGGRILYATEPHLVQTDGGTINKWTGVTGNLNLGKSEDSQLAESKNADFISGASMVASREFIEQAGPMPEDYFLYYEEVEWAKNRGALPLKICHDAIVYHRAGTAIGSPTLTQTASPFSVFFKYRARMRFMNQFHPTALPIAYGYALAKAAQFLMRGRGQQALAVLKAIHGFRLSTDKATQPRHQPVQRRT